MKKLLKIGSILLLTITLIFGLMFSKQASLAVAKNNEPITTSETETPSKQQETINEDIPSADKEVIHKEEKIVTEDMYATTSLNVRKEPNINSEIIYTLNQGDKITRVEDGEDWDTITVDGKKYYVREIYISKTKPEDTSTTNIETEATSTTNIETESYSIEATYTASQFKSCGVIYWGDWKWTWYSQKVLPGGGLEIPGRHVDENNYICDENNYICLASSTLPKGTVIDTPFGKKGKIYDYGCAAHIIDVYTNF